MEIELDFGSGWEHVPGVQPNSIILTETLHNDLNPVENTLSFEIKVVDGTIQNKLAACENPKVRLQRDGETLFMGFVRPNFIDEKGTFFQSKVDCITILQNLKRKIDVSIGFSNIRIVDNSDTSSSLLHIILSYAGVSPSDIIFPDIPYVLPVWSNIAYQDQTYYAAVVDILKEYGYILSADSLGRLVTYQIRPDNLTPVGLFKDQRVNCIGVIKRTKTSQQYKEVRLTYSKVKMIEDATLFEDTSDKKVAGKSYYNVEEGATEWYANYYDKVDNKDLLGASNANLDFEGPSNISVQTFTPGLKRALTKIYNSATPEDAFTKLKIKGRAAVKNRKITCYAATGILSDSILKMDARYIFDQIPANNFINDLIAYYSYSDFKYQLTSRTSFDIGDIVNIEGPWGSLLARVLIKRIIFYEKDKIEYTLEGVAEHIYKVPTIEVDEPSGDGISDEVIKIIDDAVEEATSQVTVNKFPDDTNLHAYYSLNDQAAFYSDGLVYDNSGKGNHGKSYGCTLLPASKNGRGYLLADGSYAELDIIDAIDDSIKISIWVKTDATSGCLLSSSIDSGEVLYSLKIADGKVAASYMYSDGTYTLTSLKSVNDNSYHHIIFETSFVSGAKIYIDGLLDARSTQIAQFSMMDRQGFYLGVENEVETLNGEDGFYYITEDQIIMETE